MLNYRFQSKKRKLLRSRQEKWNLGLNKLVSKTQIKPNELASMTDCQLVEDGKIQCPRDGQDYYGSSQGSRITGIHPYYLSDGTKQLLIMSGTSLYKYNSGSWSAISGKTYTTTKNTNFVTAYDKSYIVNGVDSLTYYNGTSITTFTNVSAPTSPTATRTGGSSGSHTFSYKITSVTATGESTPTAAATATADFDVSAMDSSHYITVGWTAAASAIGYNVYGRKDGKWYHIAYVEGQAAATYKDDGTITPNELVIPPEQNSTSGPIGKVIEIYKDSLFLIGDPNNPSRLFYSAGGDLINDFSAANGGGFIDVSKNDGQKGIALKIFKNSLLIFKEHSIYQFEFSSAGAPQLTQVTGAIGCVAARSVVTVENDVMFAADRGIFAIGNEQGFAFDVLRTNEISARVRSIFQSIDPAYIENVAAVYATKNNTNLVIFSYTPSGSTTNSKALVYDRERLAWHEWTNIKANCWGNYTDASGIQHVLYGDDSSGYVKEALVGSDDFGSAIQGSFSLKSEDYGAIEQRKVLKHFTAVLRKPSGSVNLSIIIDGTTTAYTANINTISPSINFGHYVFGRFLFGESYGTGSVEASDDIVVRTKRNANLPGKTFQFVFDNGSSGANFVLLSVSTIAKPKSEMYRSSEEYISA